MNIDKYAEALREDLVTVAALGDESVARAAELLSAALDAACARRLQEALAEAALEVSGQLEHGRVEVRMAGGDPELVFVEDEPPPPADAADSEFSARITLRLPEGLKSRIDTAAAQSGVSVNTWLVRALTRWLEPPPAGPSRHRMTGYGRN